MSGKLKVQKKARGDIGLRIREVLGSRAERDNTQIERGQKVRQRFADLPVIVHDEHDVVFADLAAKAASPARS